ncbi:hypothetical protein [Streptomyces sp. MMG1533]|uniref:hypothetical protein n=1 Tax=Streptomyces sp. MMG1533 TaxID=1415546 RepID=UPI000A73DB5B|nr:hypothetical protein [Streptomyces sp. MMG1533]
MSDNKQQHQDPHQAEKKQVSKQVGIIDTVSRVVEATPFGGAALVALGRTNFEGHDLNDMIDLVESANPGDLEAAGKALWDAQDAIEKAANELKGHIGRVLWEGESATAFHEWGDKLVKHALGLATFAGVTGTQITAAATGLASVRTAMPPRDSRLVPKTVDQIPTPMQVEGNKEYAAAVKVEKDRQEAINQMNRLASFYTVSEEVLAAQEPPTFEPMPDVGVPKPDPSWKLDAPDTPQGSGALGAARESASTDRDSSSVTGHSRVADTTPPLRQVDDPSDSPERNVGTKIDSVGTLPPQETTRPTTNVSPVIAPSGPNGGPVPPLTSGPVPPAVGKPTGRNPGLGGVTGNKSPVQAQGRTATPSGTASGRSATGPMGRANTTGQSGIRGGPGAADRSPMGRGISGGTARAVGGQANGRAGGMGPTGAARSNGVVGGRPTTGTQGMTGPRLPRGTVVGAESNNTGSRPSVGKVGQRGVIGAQNATPGAHPGQTARPAAGNSDGVVGTPKGRAPAGRSGGLSGGAPGTAQGSTASPRGKDRDAHEGERQPETQRRNARPETD